METCRDIRSTTGGCKRSSRLPRDSFFQPRRASTGISVETTPNRAVTGQEVSLTAYVQASDNGGTVSFYDSGVPIAGCQSIALTTSSSCTSTGLAIGANAVTAVYSGDTYNQGSDGKAASTTIVPLTFVDMAGFAGVPDLSPVGALFFGPQVDGVPLLSALSRAPSPGSGGGDSDPFALLEGVFRGKHGLGAQVLLIGSSLMLLGGAYMAVTWVQDQLRRRRRLVAATRPMGHAESGR